MHRAPATLVAALTLAALGATQPDVLTLPPPRNGFFRDPFEDLDDERGDARTTRREIPHDDNAAIARAQARRARRGAARQGAVRAAQMGGAR